MIDHIVDKKSLYLQSPQSLTQGKGVEAGIEAGIEVWGNAEVLEVRDEDDAALEQLVDSELSTPTN